MGTLFLENDKVDKKSHQNNGDKDKPQPKWRNGIHIADLGTTERTHKVLRDPKASGSGKADSALRHTVY
jgi:hypothetical protein